MQAENDETEKQLFKCGRVEDSPNDIFTNVFAPMYQIYKRISGFDDFVEGHNDKYIFSVINTIVDSTKRQRRIELNTHYGFEELYFVYSLERLYGPAYSDICHFFIDEFQNYSKSELTVISGLYGSCKIDAFGDPSQRIDNKDVSLYELLSEDPKWQPFFINENYRNSIEITEYLNQEFGMNMTPIGLHGKMIQANDLKEGIKALDFHPDSNDRVALIYNGGWLKRLQASVPEAEANFISDDNPEIVRNKINILTPAQAKGLEFERVLVVSLGMTKEEKYVACSRPLNVLILVEKSRED
jgi:DNA helicase IV